MPSKPETLSPHDPEFWKKIAARLPVCEENRQLWTGAACAQLAALGFPANPLLSQCPEGDMMAFFAWMRTKFVASYQEDDVDDDGNALTSVSVFNFQNAWHDGEVLEG